VSHVVRGLDLKGQTAIHRMLQALLGLPAPELYHHHRLILDAEGRKLSKSDGAASLRGLRAAGATPGEVYGLIGLSAPAASGATP
jgi:glutamyl-Q tRNA(Asp) synthetase